MMLNLGPLKEELLLTALKDNDKSLAEIEKGLKLKKSLLFIAITENFQSILQELIHRGENFNQRNSSGETIAHQVLEVGTKSALECLKNLVVKGYIDINAKTDIFSNPFHYAAQITDPAALTICFSMATAELLMQQNQNGACALNNAIACDNALFLEMAIEQFPRLIDLKIDHTGQLLLTCGALLHDIANRKAHNCYSVLKNKFSDHIWSLLNQHRIEEQLPIDVAALEGHRQLFQTFKGYRHGSGISTLTWIAAQQIAKTNQSHLYPHLQEMIDDAKEDQEYQAELDNWQGEDQTIEKEAHLPIIQRRRLISSSSEMADTPTSSSRRRSF